MAPKRKTISETSSSKTSKQQCRFSQRVIGMTANHGTNKSIAATQQKKKTRSKGQQNKKNGDSGNHSDVIEESELSILVFL